MTCRVFDQFWTWEGWEELPELKPTFWWRYKRVTFNCASKIQMEVGLAFHQQDNLRINATPDWIHFFYSQCAAHILSLFWSWLIRCNGRYDRSFWTLRDWDASTAMAASEIRLWPFWVLLLLVECSDLLVCFIFSSLTTMIVDQPTIVNCWLINVLTNFLLVHDHLTVRSSLVLTYCNFCMSIGQIQKSVCETSEEM